MSTVPDTSTPPPYWSHFTDGSGSWRRTDRRPPGEDLAALRSGAGREPGTVPGMWPHHHEDIERWVDGGARWEMPRAFAAEHHALVLYGFHQQSVPQPMHRIGPDFRVGASLARLRQIGDFSEEAIDRRFVTAATATSLSEVTHHLRHLIAQLRGIRQPLDYRQLHQDLTDWADPARQHKVRRDWGLQYYVRKRSDAKTATTTSAATAPTHD